MSITQRRTRGTSTNKERDFEARISDVGKAPSSSYLDGYENNHTSQGTSE